MRIEIEDLHFEAILGILPKERTKPQRVRVDIAFDYSYQEGEYIDYASVCMDVQERMQMRSHRLIEEALDDLGEYLLRRYPSIDRLEIKITKPDILPNAKVGAKKSFSNPQTRALV